MKSKTKKKSMQKSQLTFLEAIVRAGEIIDKIDRELTRAKGVLAGGNFEIKETSVHGTLPGRRVGLTDHHISLVNEWFKDIADLCDEFDEITKHVQQQKLGDYMKGFSKTKEFKEKH